LKAVFYNKYGSPDVLEIGELGKPIITENEILVQAYASSVNPVDWKIRNGSMKIFTGKKFPKGLGGDIAGKIVEIGEKITCCKTGRFSLKTDKLKL
jgi:NADPH:quinone reductase-like Zn-dependent oxidoreductase